MAIYHCSTKPLARSSGRSAVAAAAYRAGDCLTDSRQGIQHDYTRRSGVLHSELVLPVDAGAWTRSDSIVTGAGFGGIRNGIWSGGTCFPPLITASESNSR